MKSVILDSGPIISLALNNILWLFKKAKEDYGIQFYITDAVKKEIVDHPLETKKFKFEALQVMRLIDDGIIKLIQDKEIRDKTQEFLDLANASYSAHGRPLTLVHFAEMSIVCANLMFNTDAIMMDERTTRYLLERPEKLRNILRHKLHTEVTINKAPLSKLRKLTKKIKIIRSAEFATVAYEKGLLDKFLPQLPCSHEILLDGLLWGLKLNGCAISTKDLETINRIEAKSKKCEQKVL